MEDDQQAWEKRQSPRCGRCRKLGHFALDCQQNQMKDKPGKEKAESQRKPKKDLKDIECFVVIRKATTLQTVQVMPCFAKPHNTLDLQNRLS